MRPTGACGRRPRSRPSVFSRRAEDRWYVADPRCATDLHRLCERVLPKEFDDYRGFPRKLTRFRLEAVRTGFRCA